MKLGSICLAGNDRYQTAGIIAEDFNSSRCDNIILASGEDFPGALSVSGFSGFKQYPAILAGVNYLSAKAKEPIFIMISVYNYTGLSAKLKMIKNIFMVI